jgi:riboflavin kinase/FMN adenylyltransferase
LSRKKLLEFNRNDVKLHVAIKKGAESQSTSMKIVRSLKDIPEDLKGGVITIGNFDGVHLAHQAILNRVLQVAKKTGSKAIVMTFEPHPQQVLHPERKPFYLITTLDEKLARLEEQGIDAVILIEFSLEFAKTTAQTFARDILCGTFQPTLILIGHDYTFGSGKEGKPEYLRTEGRACGFDVEVMGAVEMEDGIVSSTRVRKAILEGDVSLASRLLGRPYSLRGHVVKGDRRGTDIGFPTANIEPEKLLVPGRGVYAALVEMEGKRFQSAVNIGFNPTFTQEKRTTVEAHLLDYGGNLYGRKLLIRFIERIRDEKKFEGPEPLIEQIRKDVERTREILQDKVSGF